MKLLIVGAAGQIGQALMRACADRHITHIGLSHEQLDITQPENIAVVLQREKPDYVINAAAVSDVTLAQTEAGECYAINRDGVANLARACEAQGAALLHLSTDYVFDGQLGLPYTEEHKPNPQNVYGNSKLEGEEALRELCARHIILRSSWVFGPDGNNFFSRTLERVYKGEAVRAANDQISCPTYTEHLAIVCVAIIQQLDCQPEPPLWGTYHYCDRGPTTRYDFARTVATTATQKSDLPEVEVVPVDSAEFKDRAQTARHSVLVTDKLFFTFGIRQRGWRQGVKRAVNYAANRQSSHNTNDSQVKHGSD
ncbi:MAG: dTDP-4-dehydrorhamnose reductase [Natronospirillum sp.]